MKKRLLTLLTAGALRAFGALTSITFAQGGGPTHGDGMNGTGQGRKEAPKADTLRRSRQPQHPHRPQPRAKADALRRQLRPRPTRRSRQRQQGRHGVHVRRDHHGHP